MATLRTPEDDIARRRAQAQATAGAAQQESEALAAAASEQRAQPISPRNIFPQGSPSAGVPIYDGAGLRGLRTPELGSSGRLAQVPAGFGQQPPVPPAPAATPRAAASVPTAPAATLRAAAPVGDVNQIPTTGPAAPRAAGQPLGDVNQIPTGGSPAAPAAVPQGLRGSELGRNVLNTMNALAPLGALGGMAAAARATGPISAGLQQASNLVTGGAALATAANRPATASLATPATVSTPAAVASPATDLTPTSAVPGLRAGGAMDAPAAPGAVTRVGNSYSGGTVTGDITVNGQAPGGGAISAQNMAAADALAARETLRGQAGAVAAPAAEGRPVMAAAPNSSNSWQARNDLRNLRVSANSIYDNTSTWGNRGMAKAKNDVYENAANLDAAQRAGADPGSVARTNANAAMYGDEQRAAAARYGAETSLRGTMISAGASRNANLARLQYDMAKDARDFGMRTEENATKRQENQLKARQEAEKTMVDRIAAAIPPGPDGKPNTAAAAEQVRAMTARVADRQTRLEQELAQNPGNAQARAELNNILDNGVASVGTKGLDQFQTGMDARRLRADSAGWMPWSGRDVVSNKPITSLRLDEGLLFDDYVDDQGGRIPARVVEKNKDTLRGLIR